MHYVYDTIDLIATIGTNDICKLHAWIDAAHAVHPNMRGHTGGACTFGTGVFCAISGKQKSNTGSSAECEIVGNSDFIIKPISHGLFMEAQGYPLLENVAHEDNKSTIQLLINGRK